MIRVRAWLLKAAIANVPDDDFIAISEHSVERLMEVAGLEYLIDRGRMEPRRHLSVATHRDHRGRFTRIKP